MKLQKRLSDEDNRQLKQQARRRAMKKKVYVVAILLIIIILTTCQKVQENDEGVHNPKFIDVRTWAIQLQDAYPDMIATSGFDLVVIDYSRDGSEEGKYSSDEIQKMEDLEIIPIAYISIGEAEDYRFYWKDEWYNNPPEWLGKENPEWNGNYAVKYWSSEWKQIVFNYLDKIIEQGFSGIYLDKVDEFEYWSDPTNGENVLLMEEDLARRMMNFILEIANYCKNKINRTFYVIPQNGERLLEFDTNGTLLSTVSGWAVEDLFYNGTEPMCLNAIQERTHYLDIIHAEGKPVFSVDYVDDGNGYSGVNKERINDYRVKAIEKGYIPYAAKSDRKLDEPNIIEGVQP